MPNVAFVTEEVKKLLPQYDLIRDCLAGEQQVKFRRDKYLPRPNPSDTSPANIARYNAYLTRAVFYNVSQRTLAGLVGQVFLRDPVVEVPTLLKPVVDDATGSGVTLQQLAQSTANYVMPYGRAGLYVDYPDTEEPATRQQVEDGELRPTLAVVAPWDCLNYRVRIKGAKHYLTLVVFREDYDKEDDGFETKKGDQWRVLRLDENGEYLVEIYRDKMGMQPVARYFPQDATGARMREIPFIFVGATNNDPKCDAPPMYDLCSLNMAHYRNSADYEENVYFIGQPTPWFAGLTEEWVNKVMGGTVSLGARGAVMLPENGSAGLLQVDPNTLAKEAMDQKEAQMLALGAKLVEGSQVQRTATEADIDNVSETSVLSSVAKNVGAAIKWALEKAAAFVGAPAENIAYDMNTEFDLVNLSPEEIGAVIAAWQQGALSFEEMRTILRRAGYAYLADKVAKQQLDDEAATAIDLEAKKAGAIADATQPPEPAPGDA